MKVTGTEYHIPIMLAPAIDSLAPERGGVYIEMTLGGGGHSSEILRRLPKGSYLYGIDRDREAIAEATRKISLCGDKANQFTAIKGNFFDAVQLLSQYDVHGADGILADLGVSSHQLDSPNRGFSHRFNARLDMRL